MPAGLPKAREISHHQLSRAFATCLHVSLFGVPPVLVPPPKPLNDHTRRKATPAIAIISYQHTVRSQEWLAQKNKRPCACCAAAIDWVPAPASGIHSAPLVSRASQAEKATIGMEKAAATLLPRSLPCSREARKADALRSHTRCDGRGHSRSPIANLGWICKRPLAHDDILVTVIAKRVGRDSQREA